ncbi:MAG: substrate-binding domain-containing protein [bacterium]
MAPPLFEQVRSRISQAIAEGRFDIGQTLPPVEALASEHGCGQGTMERALTELADAGVLKRVRKRGTIVTGRPPLGRACLVLSDDEHTNMLLQDKVYEAAIEAGIDLEVLPGKLTGEMLRDRLSQFKHRSDAPRLALTLCQAWDQTTYETLHDTFDQHVAFKYDSTIDLGESYTVGPDLHAMAHQVVHHLFELGHRHIAIARGFPKETHGWAVETAEMAHNFIEVAGGTCWLHTIGNEDAQTLLHLIREHGVTAYWALNDHEAMSWETRLLRHGIRVPDDVSIVGRWDTPWAQTAPTPLTSVSIDPDTTARTLAHVLARLMRNQPPESRTQRVFPKVIARHSTAPPGSAAAEPISTASTQSG